ncbi:MAG: hypothetical protein RIQ52_1940 [Pseudomonadota bacterium]
MNIRARTWLALFLSLASAGALAESAVAVPAPHAPVTEAAGKSTDHADHHAIEESLKSALPGVKADSITASPIPGLYEVIVGPKLIYMTRDGRYLLQGSIIDAKARNDVTEPRLAVARINALKKFGDEHMVVFSPKLKKYDAYVFTDIDCGYCRKLHSEIDQYMAHGIAIHYLFFPRAGEGSDSWNKAVTVWCSADRQAAFTQAKKGQALPKKECKNPVADHYALGNAMGVQGTPMIVTGSGAILPGYVNADQLANMLEYEGKQ